MRGTADSARGRRPERFAAALGRPLGSFRRDGRPASGRPGGRRLPGRRLNADGIAGTDVTEVRHVRGMFIAAPRVRVRREALDREILRIPASVRARGRPARRTGRGPVRRAGGRPVRRARRPRLCNGRAGVRAGSLPGVSSLTESVRQRRRSRARARVRRPVIAGLRGRRASRNRARIRHPAIAGLRLRRRVRRDRTRIRRAAIAGLRGRRPAGRRILISAPAVTRAGVGAVTGRASESGWRESARWPGVSAISRRAGEGGRRGYPAPRAGLVRISSLDLLGRPCSQRDGSRRLGLTVAPGFPFNGVFVFAFFPAAPVSTVLTRGTRRPAGATCQGSAVTCRETSGIGITTGRAAAMTQVAVPVVLLVAVKAGIRLPAPARLRLYLAGLLLGPVFLPGTPRIPEPLAGRPGILPGRPRHAQLLLVLRPSAAHEPSHS